MVSAVRKGESQRSVARRLRVSLSTVQRWVQRAGERRLDRADFSDRPRGPRQAPRRTPAATEELIVQTRRALQEHSALGEYGAVAIHQELLAQGVVPVPCARTIHRVLERQGAIRDPRRRRRTPPPKGWYLPPVAACAAEMDQADVIEGLLIEDGPLVEVLTVVSLHGGLVGSWPQTSVTAEAARECLTAHWRERGLPAFAQFDNDTIFQGPHQHRDVIGSVTRLCLSLQVTPVFVPPRETGFQAAIEGYNGHWQAKVWSRYHHESLAALQERSQLYVAAHRARTIRRQEAAPPRRPFPQDWQPDLRAAPHGTVIYLRRVTEAGTVYILGRDFAVDSTWAHRLVRCDVHLDDHAIRVFGLTRRQPDHQPLLNEIAYNLPQRRTRK